MAWRLPRRRKSNKPYEIDQTSPRSMHLALGILSSACEMAKDDATESDESFFKMACDLVEEKEWTAVQSEILGLAVGVTSALATLIDVPPSKILADYSRTLLPRPEGEEDK